MNQQLSASLADLPGFPMAATKPAPAHSRRCSVCRHPDRVWIELKFIEWHSPARIAEQFDLYDPDCIYHHAHATNLFELRRRNILCIYERLLERISETRVTHHGIMLAIGRLERTVRSRLPNPAAEIETTLTRDTELTFDPKSAWGEHDQGYAERDQSAHQQGDAEAKHGQPSRSSDAAPETAEQSANSHSPERQHTPGQVPDSKQPETPESWQSAVKKMPPAEIIPGSIWAQRCAKIDLALAKARAAKRKPPHWEP
jgi:hypothetical protein